MASDSQKITLLYKKNFGVTDTQGTAAVSQESITSRARIIPSIQIFQQPIPTTLPTDFTRDFSFTKGQRWTSATYPHIVKYVNVTLKHINLFESYWFTDATLANPELNILTSAIPASYGAGFYQTIVYDSAGNPLSAAGTYPWVFDVDGGVLKFFTNLTSGNAPPTISFYRYEGTFGFPAATSATISSYTNLYTSTLQLSTLIFRDLYTNDPAILSFSNGSLYINGSLFSGGASDASLTSTTVGLGTLGYISSSQLLSSLKTLGTLGYLSSVPSTFISSGALFSSIEGLGSIGYVSTPQLTSSLVGLGTLGYLSSVPSTFISSATLLSTIQGLGTLGYLSSAITNLSSIISTPQLTSSLVGLGSMGYLSTVPSTFISSAALFSSLEGLGSMGYLSSAITNLSSIISTPQLTSSLVGLGTLGYLSTVPSTFISSATLFSSLQGLGSMGYISSAQLTSTAQGLTTYINSFIDPQELVSSITGLGTVQFISSIGLLSTSQGLADYITSFIDPLELASTVTGLGTAQYVSTTVTATNAIFTSSLVGLGSMGYLSSLRLSSIISTPQLTSSLQGLGTLGYLSSVPSTFISSATLFSTIQGLGSLSYISSVQLTSTSQGLTDYINSFFASETFIVDM